MTGVHRTTWEDSGMAGIECDGKDAGTLDTEGHECPVCGEFIRLLWRVSILLGKAKS